MACVCVVVVAVVVVVVVVVIVVVVVVVVVAVVQLLSFVSCHRTCLIKRIATAVVMCLCLVREGEI